MLTYKNENLRLLILYVKLVCTWIEQKAGKSISKAKLRGRNANDGYKYYNITTMYM